MAYFNRNKFVNSLLYLVGLLFTILIIPLSKRVTKWYDNHFGKKKTNS